MFIFKITSRAVPPGEGGGVYHPQREVKKKAQIAERGPGNRNVLNIKEFSGGLQN
jgi:hypothetical protein